MTLPATNTTTADAATESREQEIARAARLWAVVPYDPTNGDHGAFVRTTWSRGALRDGSYWARARLDEYLGEPVSRAVVAHTQGRPDQFAGWAARVHDGVLFAFVLPIVRRQKIATLLLRELGVYIETGPVPLLYWTPKAAKLAARGKWIYYAPRWSELPRWDGPRPFVSRSQSITEAGTP